MHTCPQPALGLTECLTPQGPSSQPKSSSQPSLLLVLCSAYLKLPAWRPPSSRLTSFPEGPPGGLQLSMLPSQLITTWHMGPLAALEVAGRQGWASATLAAQTQTCQSHREDLSQEGWAETS